MKYRIVEVTSFSSIIMKFPTELDAQKYLYALIPPKRTVVKEFNFELKE
jgi:hypothetical protein